MSILKESFQLENALLKCCEDFYLYFIPKDFSTSEFFSLNSIDKCSEKIKNITKLIYVFQATESEVQTTLSGCIVGKIYNDVITFFKKKQNTIKLNLI